MGVGRVLSGEGIKEYKKTGGVDLLQIGVDRYDSPSVYDTSLARFT